jgi:ribonuclease P protein component
MNEKFGKNYKLCSLKAIESVFKEGKSVKVYPFVVHFREQELPPGQPFQLVFSAPKRIFRLAHERNRIKRVLRESFRKKKLILEEVLRQENKQLALFVIYTAREELPLHKLMDKTEQLLVRITQELQHETNQK